MVIAKSVVAWWFAVVLVGSIALLIELALFAWVIDAAFDAGTKARGCTTTIEKTHQERLLNSDQP